MKNKLDAAFFLIFCLLSSVSWAGAQCSSCSSADTVVARGAIALPTKKVGPTLALAQPTVDAAVVQAGQVTSVSPGSSALSMPPVLTGAPAIELKSIDMRVLAVLTPLLPRPVNGGEATAGPSDSKEVLDPLALEKKNKINDGRNDQMAVMTFPQAKNSVEVYGKWNQLPPVLWQMALTGLSLDEHLTKFSRTSHEFYALSRLPRLDYFVGENKIWDLSRRRVEEFIAFWNRLKPRLPKNGGLEAGQAGVRLTVRNVFYRTWHKIPDDVLPHIASISFSYMPRWVLVGEYLGKFRFLKNLTHLDLVGTDAGGLGLGLSAIINSLPVDTHNALKSLNIADNYLVAEDLHQLLWALGRFNRIEELDLNTNRICAEGLLRMIRRTPNLRTLDVSRTGLNTENISVFIPGVAGLPNLESLHFSGFAFAVKDVFKLLGTLSPTMKNLVLDEIYGYREKLVIEKIFVEELARFSNLTLTIGGDKINTARLHSAASSSEASRLPTAVGIFPHERAVVGRLDLRF
jgi:hypothetical protein